MDQTFKKFAFPSLIIFSLVIVPWLMCLPKCEGTTGAQCAQFGVNDVHDFDLPWLKNSTWTAGNHHERQGYWTIGAREFDARYITFLGATFEWDTSRRGAYYAISNYTSNDSVCPWPWVICPDKHNETHDACAYWWHEIEFCIPNNLSQIRMYLVKQNGRILKGWLHVEVELMDPNDEIRLIYVQMRDEHFNAIGEFVGENEATCKPSKDSLVRPTKYQLFPCSAVGNREPKNSHGIFMAAEDLYIDTKLKDKDGWIPKKSISRGVHFLWKMDEYYCNRHQRLQPFAYIWTRKSEEAVIESRNRVKNGTKPVPPLGKTDSLNNETLGAGMGHAKTWRKIPNNWIYPQWYGATDIIFADGELDCSELAVDDEVGKVSSNGLYWLQNKVTRVKWVEDNWYPANRYNVPGSHRGSFGCQAESLHANQNYKTVPVFSGRCATLKEKAVGMDTLHSCTFDPSVLAASFEGVDILSIFGNVNYSEYKNLTVQRRLESCSFPCRGPNSTQDLEDILAFPTLKDSQNETGPNTTITGIPLVNHPYGKNLRLVTRGENALLAYKYHGILAVVITFFITPISTLMARHYKETFMKKRCFGIHVWYWVHGTGIMTSFALFSSGHATLNPYTASWGSSIHEYGKLHRLTAYVIWTLFSVMLAFGGFRPRCDGCIRLLCSTFHSVFGYTYQWLNFFAVIISTGIPFSPSAGHCTGDHGFPEFWTGALLYLTFGMIFICVAFDVALLVLQCVIDSQEEMKRGWWCPITPILPTDHLRDFRGSGIRKLLFLIFIVLSAGATVAASCIIAFNSMDNCQLGPTTCPSEFGCSHLAKKYGDYVVAECGSDCSK